MAVRGVSNSVDLWNKLRLLEDSWFFLLCLQNRFSELHLVRLLPTLHASRLAVHKSVHRDTITKVTNKMQLYRLIYYSKAALHVSGDVFAHHQEQLTVFTASGSIHPSRCRLVSWMSWNSSASLPR